MWSLGKACRQAGPPTGRAAPGLALEKARKISPEPLPDMPPVRAMPRRPAPGDALELVRQERRIGGDDQDERALLDVGVLAAGKGCVLRQIMSHRHAGDGELVAAPEVCLGKHADGVAAVASRAGGARLCPYPL